MCSLGIIADPQYCDIDTLEDPDTSSASGHKYRQFRSDKLVTIAAKAWEEEGNIHHVLQLGDLIDSRNSKQEHPEQAKASAVDLMRRSLRDFRPSPSPWVVHHVVGNNEVKNFTREELKLWIDPPFYHTFAPTSGWRVIVLDTYAVSTLGPYPPELETEAKQTLLENNPNFQRLNVTMSSPVSKFGYTGASYDPSMGLCDENNEDPRWRFVDYNGALGSVQHQWLKDVLLLAKKDNESVIVVGHTPIHRLVSNHLDSIAWDCEMILETLNASENVVMYMAGHDHQGGYHYDKDSGIHHVTVPSPLTARPNTGARYFIAQLMEDGVIGLKGEGFIEIDPGVGLEGGGGGDGVGDGGGGEEEGKIGSSAEGENKDGGESENKEKKKHLLMFSMDKEVVLLKRGEIIPKI